MEFIDVIKDYQCYANFPHWWKCIINESHHFDNQWIGHCDENVSMGWNLSMHWTSITVMKMFTVMKIYIFRVKFVTVMKLFHFDD